MKDILLILAATSIDYSGLPQGFSSSNITTAIQWAIAAAGLVAAGFLVKAGFTYVSSQGNPEKTKKALHTMLYCAVGLVLVIVAEALVAFVFSQVEGAKS